MSHLFTDEIDTPGGRAANLRLAAKLVPEEVPGPGDQGLQTRHRLDTRIGCHLIFCLKNVPHDCLISSLHCWGASEINCNLTLASSLHWRCETDERERRLIAPLQYLPHPNICFGIVGLLKTLLDKLRKEEKRWQNRIRVMLLTQLFVSENIVILSQHE